MSPCPRILMYHGVSLLLFVPSLVWGQAASVRRPLQQQVKPLKQPLVASLLETGWQVSLRNYQQAEARVGEIQRVTQLDHRLDYSFLLIQLRQRQYREAKQSLQQFEQRYSDYLPMWRARVWYSVLVRDYQAALEQMRVVSGRVARRSLVIDAVAGGGLVAASEEEIDQLVSWIGQLTGFVEGPADVQIPPGELQGHRQAMVRGWQDRHIKIFNDSRHQVLDRFAAQQVAIQKIADDATRESKGKLQELAQQQERRRRDLKERRADLVDQKRELRDELREGQRHFLENDRPLIDRLWQIDGQAGNAWRMRGYVQADRQWLEAQLAMETDPVLQQQLILEIDRLARNLSWSDTDLYWLQQQSWTVQQARSDLYWEHRRNQQQVARQLEHSADALDAVSRNEKRLEVVGNRERRKVEATSRKVKAAEARAGSLQFYLAFPLEREKNRVLASF